MVEPGGVPGGAVGKEGREAGGLSWRGHEEPRVSFPEGITFTFYVFNLLFFAQGMYVDFGMNPGKFKVYQRQFVAILRINQ